MNTIKKIVCTGFLIVLVFLSVRFFCGQCLDGVRLFRIFSGKSLDDRYAIVDGGFGRFMSFCGRLIPAGSDVLFYNSWENYRARYQERATYQFEFERQISRFYLYPIRVHTFFSEHEKLCLPIHPQEEFLGKVSYIIASFPDRDFPGFKVVSAYDPNRCLLKKEE